MHPIDTAAQDEALHERPQGPREGPGEAPRDAPHDPREAPRGAPRAGAGATGADTGADTGDSAYAPPYRPPLDDLRFVFHDVLRLEEQADVAGFADLTPDVTDAILGEAGRIAAEVLRPINPVGDRVGCRLADGPDGPTVTTPPGLREAYDLLRAGGWTGLEAMEAHGGQEMPAVLGLAVGQVQSAANMGAMMYHGLTAGAYRTLLAHGSEEQKALYLPKLASGEWMGTMNLTEPQCGTDLGLVRTRAEPRDDGTHAITGQKIWITSGEHDLADNIVHLVLARIPGAPEGTRGLSLFVVPKYLPEADGSPGARNAVTCVGLERKMGIHASATCAMAYEGATGWLVGEAGRGLPQMFTMMNHARLQVAMQGVAVAQAACQQAVTHARERLQGRAVAGAVNPDGPADPIIAHADVRRMLMELKATAEGGTMLLAWVASLLDREARHRDPAEREAAARLLALLTPVAKGHLTEEGFRMTALAQQVLGGAGYIADTGLEQIVRDARITTVYEGTTGVQAMDLVGRKLGKDAGKALRSFLGLVAAEVEKGGPLAGPLKAAADDLQAAAMYFLKHGAKDPDAALGGSVDFLHLFGQVAMGLSWSWMARAAQAGLDAGAGDGAFQRAKLATAGFFAARMLPETALRRARIESGPAPLMELEAEAF